MPRNNKKLDKLHDLLGFRRKCKARAIKFYISNDINLDLSQQGILLYGTNAVGKSSFIKSLGIAVIMAQAGFYVPCSKMTYYPFDYIFTRIFIVIFDLQILILKLTCKS